jgi:hypothetical protein
VVDLAFYGDDVSMISYNDRLIISGSDRLIINDSFSDRLSSPFIF